MVEHSHAAEIGTGGVIGAAFGYVAHVYASSMVAAPVWFPYLLQGCVTLIVTCIAIVIGHFLKRWLVRRWPTDAKD